MGVRDAVRRRVETGSGQPPTHAHTHTTSSLPADDGAASLRRRCDELVAHVAELHWDLGGLTYEMAIRDHFRLDVLVGKAAELQARDAELGELERVLSLREHAGAGQCPHCGAVRSRGAIYCWQCGQTLMERAAVVPDAATIEVPTTGAADSGMGGGTAPAPGASNGGTTSLPS